MRTMRDDAAVSSQPEETAHHDRQTIADPSRRNIACSITPDESEGCAPAENTVQ